MAEAADLSTGDRPTFAEAARVWARIGVISFGGPVAHIALMHRVLVDEKRWIDESRFLSALNFCMLLPGPEAMQLATYVGWRLHGVRGGLAAGLLFVLPGAVLMLALSLGYAVFGALPAVEAVFLGIKAAVLAIVIEALARIARRALRARLDWLIAAAAFLAIYFFGVPFPAIVLAAGVTGYLRSRSAPRATSQPVVPVAARDTLRMVAIWLAIWIVPLIAIAGMLGPDHVLSQLAWFFSKLAVVTFGGAYAVLAYMAQAAVETYQWLTPGEMLDGLGLAETTPGPLILVTQFVGTIASYRLGEGPPVLMGVLGSLVTLWATFAPCFLWIFAGAPYVERLNSEPRLKSALAAITAAVVGVVLNLSVWFALHVFFTRVDQATYGPLRLHMPELATAHYEAIALSVVSFVLIFALKRSIVATLAICGALAWGRQFLS